MKASQAPAKPRILLVWHWLEYIICKDNRVQFYHWSHIDWWTVVGECSWHVTNYFREVEQNLFFKFLNSCLKLKKSWIKACFSMTRLIWFQESHPTCAPLHVACRQGNVELIQLLLDLGADVQMPARSKVITTFTQGQHPDFRVGRKSLFLSMVKLRIC